MCVLFIFVNSKEALLISDISMAAGTLTWSVRQAVTCLIWQVSSGKNRSARIHEHSIAFSILQSVAFYVCLYN